MDYALAKELKARAREIIEQHLRRYHGRYEVSPLTLKEVLGEPLISR